MAQGLPGSSALLSPASSGLGPPTSDREAGGCGRAGYGHRPDVWSHGRVWSGPSSAVQVLGQPPELSGSEPRPERAPESFSIILGGFSTRPQEAGQ